MEGNFLITSPPDMAWEEKDQVVQAAVWSHVRMMRVINPYAGTEFEDMWVSPRIPLPISVGR